MNYKRVVVIDEHLEQLDEFDNLIKQGFSKFHSGLIGNSTDYLIATITFSIKTDSNLSSHDRHEWVTKSLPENIMTEVSAIWLLKAVMDKRKALQKEKDDILKNKWWMAWWRELCR